MAVPIFSMGLLGFPNEDHFRNVLRTRTRVRWKTAPHGDADALWVNGAAASIEGRLLRVHQPSGQELVLSTDMLQRPLAICAPVPADAAGYETFDPKSAASIASVLENFEKVLRPLAVQLQIAEQLARRQYDILAPVYHLTRQGELVAVVVRAGAIGVKPGLSPAEVGGLAWHARPEAAGDIPARFEQASLRALMWRFAMRTDEDLLPVPFRKQPIRLQEPPAVPQAWLRDAHLALLSALAAGPLTARELKDRTGLDGPAFAQALGALHFAGSLSVADRADEGPPAAARRSPLRELFSRSMEIPPRPGLPADEPADTVPTSKASRG
jgi:hypothetical protein